MKWILGGVWIATLAAALGLGHYLASREPARNPAPVRGAETVETGLSEALHDRDVLTRTYRLVELLQQLDASNIDAAVATFEAQRVGVTAFEVRLFMFSWSRFDPSGAFEWANAWRGPWRGTLENAAIYAWGFRKPRDATAVLDALESARSEDLRTSLVSGWARSGDTPGLTDYLFSRPASRERSRFIGMLLAELIQHEHGADEVRSWAESIPRDAPNQARTTAFLTAGGALAQNDPRSAAALFEAHQEFAYAQPALRTIARRWIDFHDPEGLFEWLATLNSGETRNDATEAGFSRWLSNSPREARRWLQQSSRGEALDPAVAVIARETSRASPARAIEWADGIHDPQLRRRVVTPILRLWAAQDRNKAHAWMNKHDVPREIQRELLNP